VPLLFGQFGITEIREFFYNGVVDGVALLYDVKVASWKWWIGSGKSSPCLFYEWVAEPVLCMYD
jgi:hypothetical protein